jgi:PDDEXK-like domain of unknown function (DUF3799)
MNARTDIRPMGVVYGMDFADYHAVEALSASGMRHLARSPWHFKNRVEITPTRPMLNGTLAHCAILEPGALADRYVVVPEDAPKRPTEAQWNAKKSNESSQAAKEWWAAWGEEAAGRTVVEAKDYAITQAQLAAVGAEPELRAILASGQSEVSVFWIDAQTGIYCKARIDWLHTVSGKRVRAMDLKSTTDESPRGFGRAAARMKYELQAAHYENGLRAVGFDVQDFVFGVVTSAHPVLAVPYLLPIAFADQGRKKVCELYDLYARCMETNTWPSYGSGLLEADIPAYVYDNTDIEVGWAE